jgi:hypothetical protein
VITTAVPAKASVGTGGMDMFYRAALTLAPSFRTADPLSDV